MTRVIRVSCCATCLMKITVSQMRDFYKESEPVEFID